MIKNITLILALLLSLSSFSQTKKKKTVKKQTKEIAKKDVKPKEALIVEKVDNDVTYSTLTTDPDSIQTVEIIDDNTIYNTAGIEVKPEFPGGTEKFNSFMSRNIKLTNEMKESEIKGKVFASFVIEKDGTISNIKIIRDIGYGMAEEVIRVLKSMPKWNPGEQNGKKVRCSYMVPIMIYATKQE